MTMVFLVGIIFARRISEIQTLTADSTYTAFSPDRVVPQIRFQFLPRAHLAEFPASFSQSCKLPVASYPATPWI